MDAQASGLVGLPGARLLSGEGAFIRDREQLLSFETRSFSQRRALQTHLRDFAYSLVRIPRQFLADFAEERLS